MNQPPTTNPLTQFTWSPQPEAQRLVSELVDMFLSRCPAAAALAARMKAETGTRFIDWVDNIIVPVQMGFADRLPSAGFVERPDYSADDVRCWSQPHGVFPLVAISDGLRHADMTLSIKVESVGDFAAVNGLRLLTDGPPLIATTRRALIQARDEAVFYAIERHGYRGLNRSALEDEQALQTLDWSEKFRSRHFPHRDENYLFAHTQSLVDNAISDLGPALTTDLFFAAEREYWQRRNRAAQFQKARQDRPGLGWANHDHHTYRSSRKHFARLIALWEKLGFELRERFYAGADAGWGAQICEHPACGIITFNDVDLSPDELVADFAHEPLPDRKELGTVGLWCALHGESILNAGMHHLECQFDFESLRQQMQAEAGIKTMKPFTDFPHLRQAFTEGERWPVAPERIKALLDAGHHGRTG